MDTLFTLDDTAGQSARIKVIGIGGGGGNALNNMIEHALSGVDFIAANTDAQAIEQSHADVRIQLGAGTTRGLGAGANMNVGKESAEAESDHIREYLQDTDMLFIAAGMGGGTGTGAAPVVAEIARDMGILTVAVVTKPFGFEGKKRMKQADLGIAALHEYVDTLITIPNEKLIGMAGKNDKLLDMFRKVDDVLLQAVRGISELITKPGYMNVDFADVRSVMSENRGMAMMASGAGTGENRASDAAEQAIASPLLEDIDIHGAMGLLVNVTATEDLGMVEYNEAVSIIQNMADEDANVICGMVYDANAGDELRVTVVATGLVNDMVPKLTPVMTSKVDIKVPPLIDRSQLDHGQVGVFGSASIPLHESVGATGTFDNRQLDIPTYQRENDAPEGFDEKKYDTIPAFIRRQAD
ncbi:MAG: cell division protein FtsZ [Mariprofundaceae bacterium]